MPLSGDQPSRKVKQFDREEAEERAFRMLSEGKKKSDLRFSYCSRFELTYFEATSELLLLKSISKGGFVSARVVRRGGTPVPPPAKSEGGVYFSSSMPSHACAYR